MPRTKNREIIKSLKDRFLDGDKLTIDEIVEDYFAPASPYSFLVAKGKVRQIINGIKVWFRREHGLWFGNIDDQHHYGLFTEKEEVVYGMTRYYRFVKGVLFNANILATNAKAKGLLPKNVTTERMLVAKIEEEDNGR